MRFVVCCLMLFLVICGCCACSREKDTASVDIVYTETEAAVPVMAETVLETLPLTETIPAPTAVSESQESLTSERTSETAPLTELPAEPSVVTLPRLRGLPIAEAQAILENAGIGYTVLEEYSRTAAVNEVLSVRFFGEVFEDGYAVECDKPVSLTVSLGYRPIVNMTAPEENRVYLTFDDGPCAGTDEILAILDTYDIKATFFTLGMYAAVYPARINAIVDGGHCLACHSYSHNYMELYESADTVFSEIESWKRAIMKATETEPENIIFRFPGGSTTKYMDEDRLYDIFFALTDAGIRVFDWTFADNDRYLVGKTEAQSMEDYLLESTKSSLAGCAAAPAFPKIMLMHDTSPETVAVLPAIIEYLQGEGYTFGTLDELEGSWILAGM